MFTRRTLTRHVVGASMIAAASLSAESVRAQTFYTEGRGVLELLAFGSDVAVADGRVFVGEAGRIMGPGVVYVFERDVDGAWEEIVALSPADGTIGDAFGTTVSSDGTRVVVAAPAADGGRGRAYVFERAEDGVWRETGAFGPEREGEPGFGSAVAISGDYLALAWAGLDQLNGAVEVYRRSGDGWSHWHTLTHPDSVPGTAFGGAVAMDGDRLLVSAPLANELTGGAYSFRMREEAPEFEAALEIPEGVPGGLAGAVVALDGPRAVLAAPNRTLMDGSAYVFRWNEFNGGWLNTARLQQEESGRRDAFATSLAVGDGVLWVGAPATSAARGAAHVFEVNELSEEWPALTVIEAEESEQGDAFSVALGVSGGVAAVASTGVDNQAGIVTIFERDDEGWRIAAEVASEAESMPAISGDAVECTDGRAGSFECESVDIVSFLPVPEMGGRRGIQLNDMWGWTDPETGRDYALVGRTDGLSFVDVTDPSNPRYDGDMPKTEGTPTASWRDVKVHADHAYVVADGSPGHGMQIFDLTRLRDVGEEPETFAEDAIYEGISSAHKVFVNEDTGFGYIVGANGGGETCGGGLHMVNLSDPLSPEFAGCFADETTGRSLTGYSHDVQCVVYEGPDTEYIGREICFGSNETALSISDVTQKDSTIAISSASYPAVAYAHQGWLTEDQAYFFLGDELDEGQSEDGRTRTLVWDVSDLDDPLLVTEYVSPAVATDHNLYIVDGLMYQSNYEAGLRIVDVSDPANPVEVAYFDTVPYRENTPEMSGSWTNYPFFDSGVILVTSRWEGLFILRKKRPIM